jgi:polyferredoxin
MSTHFIPLATIKAEAGHAPARRDLLQIPALGRFLRWRHARTLLQLPLFLLALLLLYDGFLGPQLAPKNLATVSVWIHYRGVLVLTLLLLGNFFCLACPFMLPRRLAKHLQARLGGGRPVPRWLRGKWAAAALVATFFFTYEYFDLWASPLLTAWVILAYFVGALLIDSLFRGAAFCKHLCPIGQFNFVYGLLSPTEVAIRAPTTCATCTTKECIAGAGPSLPGCELHLFLPKKVGNMDCTFCLDCIHACPYDNIGIMARLPGAELIPDPKRSGIGHFSQRPDLALLLLTLGFGGYVNAFAMIRPVYALELRIAQALGLHSEFPILLLIFVVGLGLIPGVLVGGAAWATLWLTADRRLPTADRRPPTAIGNSLVKSNAQHSALTSASDCLRAQHSALSIATRYSFALVPLFFGMWLAHYTFHVLTGALTILPVTQTFLRDVGLPSLGVPRWELAALLPSKWIFPIQMGFLYSGLLGSIVLALLIAQQAHHSRRLALRAALPWMGVAFLLVVVAIWIMLQPMEMRGSVVSSRQ